MIEEDGDEALIRVLGLSTATPDELAALRPSLHLAALEPGEPLLQQGEIVDALTAVISGRLALAAPDAGRQEFGPGDWIGKAEFFARRPAAEPVIAVRESVVLKISREDFPFAIHACPALWRRLMPEVMAEETAPVIQRPPTRLLVLWPGGGDQSVPPNLAEAVTSAFEALCEVRSIGAGSFGAGMPGGITMDSAQARHWLQEQELAFDLTLIFGAAGQEQPLHSVAEADEILLLVDEHALPGLEQMPLVQSAVEARGKGACRLAVIKNPKQRSRRNQLPAPSGWRSQHWLSSPTAECLAPLARLVLGRSPSLIGISSGAHAAAIWGALRALDDAGLIFGLTGAAGSAALPVSLLAGRAPVQRIEAAFQRLADAARFLRRPSRIDYGLYDPRPVDEFFVSMLPDLDITQLETPFVVAADDLSTRETEIYRTGKLRGLVRTGILPPGILPPVVVNNGRILVSGETRPDALVRHVGALNAGPMLVLETRPGPLGPASIGYRELVAGPRLRIPGRSLPPPAEPRIGIEAQLLELSARHRSPIPADDRVTHWAIPVVDGISPLDWSAWRALYDRAYEWTRDQIETLPQDEWQIVRQRSAGEEAA